MMNKTWAVNSGFWLEIKGSTSCKILFDAKVHRLRIIAVKT